MRKGKIGNEKKLVKSTKGATRKNKKCGENRHNEMVEINPDVNHQIKY